MSLKSVALWTAGRLLSVLVFVAVSFAGCSGAYHASKAVFYPAQTDFSGGTPPDFPVVVEDREATPPSEPFTAVPLRRLPELIEHKSPDILRLSRKEYSGQIGDPWGFKVVEETPQAQVVEQNSSGIQVRYRAEGGRVTPLYYKSDGGIILILFLMPVFLLCLWLGLWAARRAARWLRPSPPAS